MEKDAINQTKKKSTESHSESVGGSPIIFILAILAVIVIGLYFFKDKIFKKKDEKQKLSDFKKEPEQPTEPEPTPEPTEPEVLDGKEEDTALEKFSKLS